MKILFVGIAWPSPGERNIYSDLMDEFASQGHDVYVISILNNNQQVKSGSSIENGIRVLRVQSGKIRKTSNLRKALSLLTLGRVMYRVIKRDFKGIRFNLIISPTPPVTLSILLKKLKIEHKAYFYLLLKDIWPQVSVDLKVLRKYSVPWFYLRWHEKRIYRIADYIGTMSPMNSEYLLAHNRFIPPAKVEECPNSIKPSSHQSHDNQLKIRDRLGIPADACIFLFSGNLGKGHGFDFLINTILKLSDYPKAFFVIGGSGTHYKYLKEALDKPDISNVLLYNWLPRKEFEEILHTSDVGLILLNHLYTTPEFPSRLLSYLDTGMPVLCAINRGTDIGSVVENANCGTYIFHGDVNSFINEIRVYSEDQERRFRMGENARKLLLGSYTTSTSYNIIMKHFEQQ